MSKWGSMRASDADREQVISRLRAAATEGRLASDELEQRVNSALRARTYAELDATIADLPTPTHARRPARPATRHAGGVALAVVRTHPLLLLVVAPVVFAAAAMLLAATIVWAVLMVTVMVIGGRHRAPRSPWMYTRYRRAYYAPRRPPRSYSA